MDPKDLDPLYYNPEIIIDTVTILKSFLYLLLLKFFQNGIHDGFPLRVKFVVKSFKLKKSLKNMRQIYFQKFAIILEVFVSVFSRNFAGCIESACTSLSDLQSD